MRHHVACSSLQHAASACVGVVGCLSNGRLQGALACLAFVDAAFINGLALLIARVAVARLATQSLTLLAHSPVIDCKYYYIGQVGSPSWSHCLYALRLTSSFIFSSNRAVVHQSGASRGRDVNGYIICDPTRQISYLTRPDAPITSKANTDLTRPTDDDAKSCIPKANQ